MIEVIKAGMSTTIQDGGRKGYRDIGVPYAGAMDMASLRIGNLLLGNAPDAPSLEIALMGPTLKFCHPTFITLTGAIYDVYKNDELLPYNTVCKVDSGDIITYKKRRKGCRAYLCVKDGLHVPLVLGSTSMYHPITAQSRLANGNTVPYLPCHSYTPTIQSYRRDAFLDKHILDVYPGPEYTEIADDTISNILATTFTISQDYNRMGYRLHETIDSHKMSILTSATLIGTVQYTPAGKLIILMNDGPTTGGYPRIFQLDTASIYRLAQKQFGDKVSFGLI